MMRIEIRKAAFFDEWLWTCPTCHAGCNIPWESAKSQPDALRAAELHIAHHRTAGQRLEWVPVALVTL